MEGWRDGGMEEVRGMLCMHACVCRIGIAARRRRRGSAETLKRGERESSYCPPLGGRIFPILLLALGAALLHFV
jgi:hypothetical protein